VRAYPSELGLSVYFHDITEQRLADRRLRESEERYRGVAEVLQRTLDLSLDMITTINQEGYFVTVNAACRSILGFEPEELIGRPYLEFVHPEDRTRTAEEDSAVEAGRATTIFQNRYIHKGGEVVWLEWTAVVQPGDPLLHCVARDITERKRAEEEQAFLAAIVQASDDAITGVNPDGTIRSWNGGAERMYGYSAEEAVGQPVTLVIPPEHRDVAAHAFEPAARGERVEPYETARVAKDGHRVPVFLAVSPVLDQSGSVIGVSAITRDITERKAAEDQIRALNEHLQQRLEHITALRAIDRAIASSLDISVTLGVVLDKTRDQLGADAVTTLLLNPHSHTLENNAYRGLRTTIPRGPVVRLGEPLAGLVALNRRSMSVSDLRSTQVAQAFRDLLDREGFVTYNAVPLLAKGKVLGVIEVFHRRPFTPSPEWQETLETMAGQAAIAVNNAQLFEELERSNLELGLAYDETIEGWAKALDLRDKETEGHSRRVTEMAVDLCHRLGMVPEELPDVRRGALLHDIGKMGVPDAILLKPGKLTDEEWVVMRRHPTYAVELLSPIKFLRPALVIPQHHHEKWDGSGYPDGLAGEAIPLAARAFAVVDVYDALRSNRPYREGWPEERVIEHIKAGAGSHFDPRVVEVFVTMKVRR